MPDPLLSHPSDGLSPEAYTVSELADCIQRALGEAFATPVWVTGEVSNLSRSNAGHIYLDLVERPSGEAQSRQALLHAMIWESRKFAINQALLRAGWGRVGDGDEIRARVGVEFFPPQGRVTLRILEVDPQYTLSRWKKERERVVALLRREGTFGKNKQLSLASAPHRIGLITSTGANAYADFITTLNESGLGWEVDFHHSGVQGDGARVSLVEALGRLSALSPEVICIVRGGGSASDLAVFDHEEVARAIALCPVPVVTGIGHELDRTVSDLVAHRSEKTPTACASWLVMRNRDYLRKVEEAGRGVADTAGWVVTGHRRRLHLAPTSLREAARGALSGNRRRLHGSARMLAPQVGPVLEREGSMLGSRRVMLDRESRQGIRREQTRLANARQVTLAYDPQRNLERGWSVTRLRGGGVVSSIGKVLPGEVLETWLADGTVVSRVMEKADSRKGLDAARKENHDE